MSNIVSFDKYNSKDVPWLSLDGIECECKVIDVYDADTVTIMLPYNEKMCKVKCRLVGIDSAEKRTKNIDEKKVSIEATKWLRDMINNKVIWVKCGDWGKWGGRMLGTLYMTKVDCENGNSINDMIVDNGYAYYYDGKGKKNFQEWYKKI